MTEEYEFKNGEFVPVKRSALLNAVGDTVHHPVTKFIGKTVLVGLLIYVIVQVSKKT